MSRALPTLVVFLLATPAISQSRADWPTWRGSDGTAVARDGGSPPTEWSEEQNIRWKATLPGWGSSSPIVWGDRIYLTTAIETDTDGTPPQLELVPDSNVRGDPYVPAKPLTKVYDFAVLALDRDDGEVAWRTVVKQIVPHERGHSTNSQASGSPITDGKNIWVHLGSRGVHCLDMDGEIRWSKHFGLMQTHLGFGEGTSPVVHGDKLVILWDHEQQSFITALDKNTGEELWRERRDEVTTWATPLIAEANGKLQVITTGTNSSRSYDLETGQLLWTLDGMTLNAIPSPLLADGVAYLTSGFNGAMLQAVRLEGAKGNLKGTDSVLWTHDHDTSYVPTPLIYDDYLYFLRRNSGVLSCLDRKTGKVHYEGRRLRMRTVYSSPVGAAGHIYITSRDGTTKVIEHGAEFEAVATNKLDDVFDATMAIVGDEIYLRGRNRLYCIAEQ